MLVPYSDSYVDRLFAERDVFALYNLISVVGADRQLSEEFWAFNELIVWASSTRSGVWQYYEGLSDENFTKLCRALDRFGLSEIAEKYRSGHRSWNSEDMAVGLDRWIDANEKGIHSAAFELIADRKDELKTAG